MAKLTLTDITSGYQLPAAYNANNTLIETAIENTLSRDGTSPNHMLADLDMNGQRILGLPDADQASHPITKRQFDAAATTSITNYDAANGNYTAAGTGADARSISGKLGEFLSVKDFGVTGDGTTDDTTKFQEAIDAALAAGATLLVPPGTYRITATLLADHTKVDDKNGLCIKGLGQYRNVQLVYEGTGYCLDMSGAAGASESGDITTRFKVEDISIIGDGTTTPTGAVTVNRCFLAEFNNCQFGTFYNSAAKVVDCANAFNLVFRKCHIFCVNGTADLSSARGTCVYTGADDTQWSSSNIGFYDCLLQFADYALDISDVGSGANVDTVNIINTGFGSLREGAIYSATTTGSKTTLKIDGCHFETVGLTNSGITKKDGITAEEWDSVSITNCHFNSIDQPIVITDCDSTYISNCSFIEAAAYTATLNSTVCITIDNTNVTGDKVYIGPCSIQTANVETFISKTAVEHYENQNYAFSSSYDNNTFTPTISSGGGTITPDVQQGWYQVVNGMCFFTIRLEVASVSTPTGVLSVGGLPYTCEETINWAVNIGPIELMDLNASDLAVIGYVNKNSTDIILEGLRDNAAAANLAPVVQAGTDFNISGMYRIKPLVSN